MRIIHFDANGWRARFDDGFDDESVARIAGALGLLWADARPGATVYVGYDGRHRAEHYAELLGGVLASFGLVAKVSDAVCPTPAVSWGAAHDTSCVGAVMLTAVESPCEYGGVLVRGAHGGPMPLSFLSLLDRTISAEPTKDEGPIERVDMLTGYREGILAALDLGALRAARLKVVADPMYGGAMGVLTRLLMDVGCEVVTIHGERDPQFGGLHPVAYDPWTDDCERRVREVGADCGVVLNGDGSRGTLVDCAGKLLTRHNLVPILIAHLVEGRGARGRVVTTLATSARAARQARRLGCPHEEVPVGFERIYAEVREGDVLIASEEYGGVCVPSHLMERDGVYADLLVLEAMAQTGRGLDELAAALLDQVGKMSYVQKDIRLDAAQIQTLRNMLPGMNPAKVAGKVPVRVGHADGLSLEFDDGSWLLLRPSRTQPAARAYAEAASHGRASELLRGAVEIARRSAEYGGSVEA